MRPHPRRILLAFSVSGAVAAVALAGLALPAVPAERAAATWTNVSWSTSYNQRVGDAEVQGVALNGKLYAFGGFDSLKGDGYQTPSPRAAVLDPARGWTALAPMPPQNGTRFGGVTHAGFATDGTYIYWAGGQPSNSNGQGQLIGSNEVWRYNVATNSYSRIKNLPRVSDAGQLAYLDGKLHYFGGTNLARTGQVGDHWALDLANQAAGWVVRAPLPNPRHHMGAAVLDGKIYAVGGQHLHDTELTTQNDVHAYDPVTNTWTQRADLPRAIGHVACATFAMDGRIVVLGGEVAHNALIADTYAYDPATNRWAALTPLPKAGRGGVAGVIAGVMYDATSRVKTTFKGVPTGSPPAWPKRFNFQPAGAPAVAGYAVESGSGFDSGRGFGWVREDSIAAPTHTAIDISTYARDRNVNSDQRLDTLLHMEYPGSVPAAWELAVPNGTYDVTVSVGDAAANFDSTHRINVEGQGAIGPFVPTSANRFASATKTVTVSDGRLTLDAKGGTNTKIDYVVIALH